MHCSPISRYSGDQVPGIFSALPKVTGDSGGYRVKGAFSALALLQRAVPF